MLLKKAIIESYRRKFVERFVPDTQFWQSWISDTIVDDKEKVRFK